ncbi:MAG: hypothetical protein U0570_08300, partial [Phycisphaerales bacterium]
MKPRNLLFSWIGDADLLALAAAHPGPLSDEVKAATGKTPRAGEGDGPVTTLTKQVEFDEVHLLSDKSPSLSKRFAAWCSSRCHVHTVKLPNPVDYAAIFEVANEVLGKVLSGSDAESEISIHLSPGTPAMTAIWVLLGKSRYPATFYQTHRGNVIPTKIPFDLFVEFVPEVLRA